MSGPIECVVLTWCTAATGIFTKTPREALSTTAATAPHQEMKNWDLAASSGWEDSKTLLPWACLNHYPEEKPKGETSSTGVKTSLQPRSSKWPSQTRAGKEELPAAWSLQHSALKKRKIKIVFKISPLGNTRYSQFFTMVIFMEWLRETPKSPEIFCKGNGTVFKEEAVSVPGA